MCSPLKGDRYCSISSLGSLPDSCKACVARSRYTVFQSTMAHVTRFRPLARYLCCSKLQPRISPSRWMTTTRASALRASPFFNSAWTRRRSSTLWSQSRMNSVDSMRLSLCSLIARPFWRGYAMPCAQHQCAGRAPDAHTGMTALRRTQRRST